MIRPRSETFFVPLGNAFVDIYFPKQSAKEIRPVIGITAYLGRSFNLNSEPYYLQPVLPNLRTIFLTFRDRNSNELLTDQPAWQYGTSVQFAPPTPYVPVMTNPRTFAALPIDPQKTSVYSLTTFTGGEHLALEFIYSE